MGSRSSFSERYGIISPSRALQLKNMDKRLKTGIWNAISTCFLENLQNSAFGELLINFWTRIWDEHFRNALDKINRSYLISIRLHAAYEELKWNEVYDFVEEIFNRASRIPNLKMQTESFRQKINNVLESERSGYRLIDGILSPITSDSEIATIEQALAQEQPFSEHIHAALRLLSDKENPDYRNSIKESISAVESICFKMSGSKKFDEAIKFLQKELGLHGALRLGFTNLYGYTSDDGGIRHALVDEQSLNYEDAHFFLIICSAFVNYVNSKMAKVGPRM